MKKACMLAYMSPKVFTSVICSTSAQNLNALTYEEIANLLNEHFSGSDHEISARFRCGNKRESQIYMQWKNEIEGVSPNCKFFKNTVTLTLEKLITIATNYEAMAKSLTFKHQIENEHVVALLYKRYKYVG
ncbi:hypothetical protein GJ496_010245 [Pomphorhynchus laevis]|nr:hypothetical protein GJ496_010245 [Pomphorhynchus laevis]